MHSATAPAIPADFLISLGFPQDHHFNYQLSPEELVQQTIQRREGVLSDCGALVIATGQFTGRSPDDKFIVKDNLTAPSIDWNNFNIPIEEKFFNQLLAKMIAWLVDKDKWIRDCYACADPLYRLSIRIINENPWSNLFAYNMFLKPGKAELENYLPDWHIIHAPGFKADPLVDGTRRQNFTIVNFTQKIILIGGSGYTGEIKKGVFSVLNYLLPNDRGVLSMHCAANIGKAGDTAIFFGLSGTGKTTLSADPNRYLIGDDEHAWAGNTVFNLEGGCYAKTIDLNKEKEPEIFNAIRSGSLIENVPFIKGTNSIDFASKAITQNTRVSYPINFISNALNISIGKTPENIFFLTCDSYGILPPVSKLTAAQAMYQFISGYTAKIAGTETGITEPRATFSACFGAPFIPLHPGKYAAMLGEKILKNDVTVWMINTGWSGGAYGTGKRINLKYTRLMISAALEGKLAEVDFIKHPIFRMMIPVSCAGVPSEILNPENTWVNKKDYNDEAKKLAHLFIENFKKYENGVSKEIMAATPITA